ncbi:MAG: PIN domain-containing protein [Desulfotomaculum sp.]|nr:PIN domain-containing protein [Desulfotomaculum sp.]MCL0080952.1 PIN domain-containing protein [Peptococcaceae bacterium]
MLVTLGLDTNIIIYYLTGQPKEKHNQCLNLIKKAEKGELRLQVLAINFWEAVWVLEKYYENPKDQIARILTLFLQLPGMECSQKEILISALNLWKQAEIDFADAYIIKTYQHLKIKTVCSYDRHLQNHEIECFNPGSEC